MDEKIINFIAQAIKKEPNTITLQSHFIEDLQLDSLDIVELLMKLEDQLGLEIPEEKAQSMKTVQDVVDYAIKYGDF
jgi:acyl carrier protein